MKLLTGFLSVLIITVFILPVQAQEHAAHHPSQEKAMKPDSSKGMGMMSSKMMGMKGMCGGMMKGGNMKMMEGHSMMIMHPFYHTIYHLADNKENLNLSDTQVEKLKDIAAEYKKGEADRKADIEKKQIDLKLLFDKNAATSNVRNILTAISETEINGKMAAYNSAQTMLKILDKDQKEKWDSMASKCMSGKEMMKGGMMGNMMKNK